MWNCFSDQYAVLQDQYTAMQSAIGPLRLSKTELLGLAVRKSRHDTSLLFADTMEIWHEKPWTHQLLIFLVLLASIILSLIQRTRKNLTSSSHRNVPTLKPQKGICRWDYPAMLVEGARQYPNTPYTIRDDFGHDYIVYPSSSFNEVKLLSMDQASKADFFNHVYFQGWPFLGKNNNAPQKSITPDLARGSPSLIPESQDHIKIALDKTIGSCTEWKLIPTYSTFQEVSAIVNATALVGPELGTDQHWLKAVQWYSTATMVAALVSRASPWFLRPLVSTAVYLPAWCIYWWMARFLRPKAEKYLREYQKESLQEKNSEPSDKLGHCHPIVSRLMPQDHPEERTLQQMTHDYIVTSIQSTTSTAMALYSMAVTLMTRPKLMDDLREELSHFIVEGHLPQNQISDLPLLHSFIRESCRYNNSSHCMPVPGNTHMCLSICRASR